MLELGAGYVLLWYFMLNGLVGCLAAAHLPCHDWHLRHALAGEFLFQMYRIPSDLSVSLG